MNSSETSKPDRVPHLSQSRGRQVQIITKTWETADQHLLFASASQHPLGYLVRTPDKILQYRPLYSIHGWFRFGDPKIPHLPLRNLQNHHLLEFYRPNSRIRSIPKSSLLAGGDLWNGGIDTALDDPCSAIVIHDHTRNSSALEWTEAEKKTDTHSPSNPFLSEASYLLRFWSDKASRRSQQHHNQAQVPPYGR